MKHKKITAIILALALVFSLTSVNAFAASYAKASVPVKLTVSNEYRAVSVTVPASFPIEIVNGTVITADNAKITNNAKYGSIKVTDVTVTDGSYKIGNYENFSGRKTVALKINGIPTKDDGSMLISSSLLQLHKFIRGEFSRSTNDRRKSILEFKRVVRN